MTVPDPALDAALAPVRTTLLATARADADAEYARAETAAAAVVAAARARAEETLTHARRRGAADAETVLAGIRSRARRVARTTVLRARHEAYEAVRAQSRLAAARLRDEPDYPRLRDHLADAARAVLGPAVTVREADGGGVVAETPGRRLDLSLARFAEVAVADVFAAGDGP